jgi:hypothetical protein
MRPSRYEASLPDEALLKELHLTVIEGERAREKRNDLIQHLFQAGYPQRVLASIVSETSETVGAPAVTDGMIQKIIKRRKK